MAVASALGLLAARPSAAAAAGPLQIGAAGRVEGAVYLDMDGDSVFGPAEPGLAGILVQLRARDGVRTARTDPNGLFAFDDVPSGYYDVTIQLGPDWSAVGLPDYSGMPVAGTTLSSVNFGLRRAQTPVAMDRVRGTATPVVAGIAPEAPGEAAMPAAPTADLPAVLGAALAALSAPEPEEPISGGASADEFPATSEADEPSATAASAPLTSGAAGALSALPGAFPNARITPAPPTARAVAPKIGPRKPQILVRPEGAQAGPKAELTDGGSAYDESAGAATYPEMDTMPRTGAAGGSPADRLATISMLLLAGLGAAGLVLERLGGTDQRG